MSHYDDDDGGDDDNRSNIAFVLQGHITIMDSTAMSTSVSHLFVPSAGKTPMWRLDQMRQDCLHYYYHCSIATFPELLFIFRFFFFLHTYLISMCVISIIDIRHFLASHNVSAANIARIRVYAY